MRRLCLVLLLVFPWRAVGAADPGASTNRVAVTATPKPLADALPAGEWQRVEDSVDRALAWLASKQAPDGSFISLPAGQPAVTSLGVMAFLSRGHQPGPGRYGSQLDRAIDYVLACQQPDGLFSVQIPGPIHVTYTASHTACYNHAVAGLMLGEVYGEVTGQRARNVKQAIERALQFTRQLQRIRPKPPIDQGGWRYLRESTYTDSDLSVTAWHLMFLRSAKNAEFDVPQDWVEEALTYVRHCWNPRTGGFGYGITGGAPYADTRGMAGAGILTLSLGGQHKTPMSFAAGDWLLAHPYGTFGQRIGPSDMFFYSAYYCSQAAAQLGGRYWERIYPAIVGVLLGAQNADGSWPPEVGGHAAMFGSTYSSTMAVLSLTPPYQLLPVYQR